MYPDLYPSCVSGYMVNAPTCVIAWNKTVLSRSQALILDSTTAANRGQAIRTISGVGQLARLLYKSTEQAAITKKERTAMLRSAKEVYGYNILATDGEIGLVEDFIFDDENWIIRHLVVNAGNWLPGQHMLVAPAWIEEVNWTEAKV
jgi:hypothetical protein